ncbi:uncharacterized protein LOC130894757 isoform X2 [Diorhabda carinulata]|uniref:uncharacterized protein LOC130448143 isoform X2 n=1 Tax=Diorhabda sublineata TaxID=1163346 RepID=UPI0024E05E61|nr:uncharacterized protein LOC130448143 isoform X2 [Diorhabda sublineata]XP_057657711.1 uncharacterized protein LOC130894757 isoform X2 [Diorhabda carinulata]
MASAKDTATFFTHGTCQHFEQVLKLYPQALRLKADRKAKKPEELIKLDNWYQNELPKKIKSRGKDAHLVHEELVQCMKWKQTRGKFFPQLSYLVKVNTPRAVAAETKRAFRKLPNLELAMSALSNLKGVGTTMASALLAAACPESAPFMADECLMAIPDIEGIDYTTKEYLKFANHIKSVADRLNKAAEETERPDAVRWSPHKVELALWTHYVVSEHKPELLSSIFAGSPLENGNAVPKPVVVVHQNGDSIDPATSDESNQGPLNGKTILDEDTTTTSFTDNSPPSLDQNEETNDSVVSGSEGSTDSIGEATKRPYEDTTTTVQPASKKLREDVQAK